MQRYEGASTIYGPHTLSAYLQKYRGLARAIAQVWMDGLHLSSAFMSTLETRGHVSLRTVSERKRVQPTELSLNSRFITSLSETSCSVRPTLSLCQRNKSRRIFHHRNYSLTLITCYLLYTKENHRKIFSKYKDDGDKTWNWTKVRRLNVRQTHILNMFYFMWGGNRWNSEKVRSVRTHFAACCTRMWHIKTPEWMNEVAAEIFHKARANRMQTVNSRPSLQCEANPM